VCRAKREGSIHRAHTCGGTKQKDRPGTENMHARQLWMVLSMWMSPSQFLREVRPNGDPSHARAHWVVIRVSLAFVINAAGLCLRL